MLANSSMERSVVYEPFGSFGLALVCVDSKPMAVNRREVESAPLVVP